MKRLVLYALMCAGVALVAGCESAPKRPTGAPIQTSGDAPTPAGCVDLRKRGGKC